MFTVPVVTDAVAAAIPDRDLIVQGDRRYSYAQIVERSNRLASYLHSRGLGCHTPRSELPAHETGQDLLGIYAYNGNEFVETPAGQLPRPGGAVQRQLPLCAQTNWLICWPIPALPRWCITPRSRPPSPRCSADLPQLKVLIQIADDSGNALLDGAVDYETVLAASSPQPPPVQPSPDDLYVLYTGGTTGMPKGVLWRQHDIFMGSFGGRNSDDRRRGQLHR